MYYKAIFDLGRPLEAKISEERAILAKMPLLPIFGSPPTPYATFATALDLQSLLLSEAEFGGIDKISALRTQEAVVDNMVSGLRDYVTIVANGDKDIILSAGFRHTKERTPVGAMTKVINVKTKMPGPTGCIDLRWKPIRGKQFYEVEMRQVTPVPPGPDGNYTDWRMVPCSPANMSLTGLSPFVRYMVRIRAKGKAGYGDWSDILEFIVL